MFHHLSFSKGADIYINDDKDPTSGGSNVACNDSDKVVFCMGMDNYRIFEQHADGVSYPGEFENTNCKTVGTTLGSSCPIT